MASQSVQFNVDLNRILKKAGDNASGIARKVALELYSKVVSKSPVDSGRLRGNWNVNVNSIDTTEYPIDASSLGSMPSGAGLLRSVSALSSFKIGDTIFVTNNMPYVYKLEYGLYGDGAKTVGGYSRQAPQGFVRITYKEVVSDLENISRKVVK
jgi:hypothetical protein